MRRHFKLVDGKHVETDEETGLYVETRQVASADAATLSFHGDAPEPGEDNQVEYATCVCDNLVGCSERVVKHCSNRNFDSCLEAVRSQCGY